MTPEMSFVKVSVGHRDGLRMILVLNHVSFELESGELMAVWGARRSGKTTLARTAAGLMPPDFGQVRLRGLDLYARSSLLSRAPKPPVAFVSEAGGHQRWGSWGVLDLLRQHAPTGMTRRSARLFATRQLYDLGVGHLAESPWRSLGLRERVLVALAKALVTQPRVLVTDNLSLTLDLNERDLVGNYLRDTASMNGMAILMITENLSDAVNAHRVASLQGGELLIGSDQTGTVVPLSSRMRSA